MMAFQQYIGNNWLVVFFSVLVSLSPGAALHVANDDPTYGKPCTKRLMALSKTKYPPHDAQEKCYDVREELKTMESSLARDVMELVAPQPSESHFLREASTFDGPVNTTTNPGGQCTLKRFNEYAICEEFTSTMAPKGRNWTALSFGGNGYDNWSDAMRRLLGKVGQDITPHVYDCYDPRAIKNTVMHPVCIGGRDERKMRTVDNDRKWEDLNDILKKEHHRSVLMKLDIEHSEFDVLQELSADSFGKIAFFTVEWHFMGNRCCGFQQHKELFQRIQKEFLVLDGEAMRWGKNLVDCGINGGYQWPPAMSVSYVARDILGEKKSTGRD